MSEPAREREIRSVELQNVYMDEIFLYTHFERTYPDDVRANPEDRGSFLL